MIATTELPCLTKQRQDLEREIAEIATLVPHAEAAYEIFADTSAVVRVSSCNDGIAVDLRVDDFQEVVPYLRELASRGYHAIKGREVYDDETKTFRAYTRGKITLWVYLTGRKCHRVQVGTKEVPVYEVRCGDEA